MVKYLRDKEVKIGVWSKGAFGYKLLTAGGTFLVTRPQCCDNTVRAESVKTFFGGHCLIEELQADWTH